MLSLIALALPAHAGTLTHATWFQTAQGIPLTRTFGQFNITGNSMGHTFISVNLTYPFFAATVFVPKTELLPENWSA